MASEFRELFPTELTPGRLADLLWDGMPKWPDERTFRWLLAVEVVSQG
jgi:hypothetical protein